MWGGDGPGTNLLPIPRDCMYKVFKSLRTAMGV